MQKKLKKLSKKQELFCQFYALTQNPRESAARAGFLKNSETAAVEMLSQQAVLKEIAALSKKRQAGEAAAGFRRLAFGSVCDAVKLCFSEPQDVLGFEKMDLFCVSEIKVKDRQVEIKFFDRLKALEKLCELSAEENEGSKSFFEALERGAKSLNEI